MTLAPLTTGPHLVPANRLAFTTPVREAGGAGHWVTIHGGDEAEPGGGVHIFISSGGVVAKGPHGLLGHHIGAVASHPSVSKAQHHPVGHEPPGARDHPHYAEAPPKPPVAPGDAGSGADTAAKRPGKPYARLSGAEQGTRQEQIGKALGAAQEAARGAKAKPSAPPAEQAGKKGTFGERREATVKAMQEKEPGGLPRYRVLGVSDDQTTCDICGKKDLKRTVALHHEVSGDVVRAGSDCAADLLRTSRGSIEKAAKQHGEKRDAAIEKALESHPNQEIIKRFASKIDRITQYHRGQKSEPSATEQAGVAHARQRIAELTAEARRDIEKQLPQDKPLPQSEVEQRVVHGRTVRTEKPAAPFSAPNAERQTPNAIADTAVAHQQAQADLAAHRAKADRNPNPWAPHLSPPVGDAKDRELAEKATRAQMAHQAVVAQQQGQAQAEQQEGQRAHEKDMVRLKAEATQQAAPITPLKGRLAGLMSPEEHARLQAEHAARPQQALPEQPKATPPKEGNLLRDKASPSGKRRLELPQTAPQPEQVAGAPKLQGSAAQEVARMESALPQRTRPLASTEVNAAVQHARRDTVEHGRVLAARLAQTAGQTPNLEVLHHGKVKTETLAELNSHAGKLPQHYKDLMHAYGTHTFVGGGTASKGGVAPAIAKSQARAYGVFAPELREVHVHPSAVKTGRGVHTLHHELGHATDHALGALRAAQGEPFSRHGGAMLDRLHNPSQTPEAAALHAKHRDNDLLSPNMRQNPEEFFADAFAMHHTQPERLKEAAPDVADYMHRIDKETRERIARARGR